MTVVLKSTKQIRHLHTLELMELALSLKAPAHQRAMAEQLVLGRLQTTTAGERITLAKRAAKRIAAALLLDTDPRVMQAALANSHMTTESVAGAILHELAGEVLVHAVCRDPRWYAQREVQVALLRNPHTPLARAVYFMAELPATVLREVTEHLSPKLQTEVAKELERRSL
jgi:hypothetical protein